MEFEGVALVGLVGQGRGLGVRRPTGRRRGPRSGCSRGRTTCTAVGRGRALEVVDEAGGPHRLVVGPVVVGGQAILVHARLDGRDRKATMYHSPGSTWSAHAAQIERVGHGKARVPVGDREPGDRSGSAIDVSCRCSIANCSSDCHTMRQRSATMRDRSTIARCRPSSARAALMVLAASPTRRPARSRHGLVASEGRRRAARSPRRSRPRGRPALRSRRSPR